MADAFKSDSPQAQGLIGMQEVGASVSGCPNSPLVVDGAACLAASMETRYDKRAASTYSDNLGLVVGPEWELLGQQSFSLSTHDDSVDPFRTFVRYLLETLLRSKTTGSTIRVYVTHLQVDEKHDLWGFGDAEPIRNDEIKQLSQIIRGRAMLGELPPIIVGDFNFSQTGEQSSFNLMSKYFKLVGENGPDHIWFGGRGSFPISKGLVGELTRHVVYLTPTLTDHNSPVTRFFYVTGTSQTSMYEIAVRTGDYSGAGTNADVRIDIRGSAETEWNVLLDNPSNDDFERAHIDNFKLLAVDLGNLESVTIGHDNTGDDPGWYLDYVEIRNTNTGQSWRFDCQKWLARDEGDHSIRRTLLAH
jgi:hypothetical protein